MEHMNNNEENKGTSVYRSGGIGLSDDYGNVYPLTARDFQDGDFVGRLSSNSVGQIDQDDQTIIISQIMQLRGRISRLIPAEEALLKLSNLRKPETIASQFNINFTFDFSVPSFIPSLFEKKNIFSSKEKVRKDTVPIKRSNTKDSEELNYLYELSHIESKILESTTSESKKSRQEYLDSKILEIKESLRKGIESELVEISFELSKRQELGLRAEESEISERQNRKCQAMESELEEMIEQRRLLGLPEYEDVAQPLYKIYPEIRQSINEISDRVNIKISRLNALFFSVLHPAKSSADLVRNMETKIGHLELKQEAQVHLEEVSRLVKRLDDDRLTKGIDVLGDESQAAIGIMTEIEQRRLVVDRLIYEDRNRKNSTVLLVIIYIIVVIVGTVYTTVVSGSQLVIGQVPLKQLRVPLLGIPWPVIVWSLIGSFAAMIYRFNRNPIYDFGDAVKWLLTRPVQGIVLGSAFYLVLTSGLFLLVGSSNTGNGSVTTTADEIVLVLSFLVSFSDRFADSVFNTLVEKYAKDTKK